MPRICYVPKTFRKESLAKIQMANSIIGEYQAQGFDLTLRQLYYQFVARDLLPNSQKSYDNLGALISDARLAGLVDWNTIQDRTRNLRSNPHWEGPDHIVSSCAQQFRIDKWAGQKYRPEVWIEKDALIGVIEGVCTDLDVPYFSCRGYTSQSEMWRAGRRLAAYVKGGQTPVIFHFGDHDPSGMDMTRDIWDRLELFMGSALRVDRIALNMNQIEEYQPPPNPAKTTDARAAAYIAEFGYESWELDALEPQTLVKLIEDSISDIRDEAKWRAACEEEDASKNELSDVAADWRTAVDSVRS
jgi:hypothetical protein